MLRVGMPFGPMIRWGGELSAHVYDATGALVKYELPAWSGYQSADLVFAVSGVEPVQNTMEANAAPNGGGGESSFVDEISDPTSHIGTLDR